MINVLRAGYFTHKGFIYLYDIVEKLPSEQAKRQYCHLITELEKPFQRPIRLAIIASLHLWKIVVPAFI